MVQTTNKDSVNSAFKSHPEALLFNAVQLERALTNLCNTLNQRGELDQGGSDANTEVASAYHKAKDVLRHRNVTLEQAQFVANFKG